MERKITGWNAKLPSTSGKDLMLKTMAQALPMYVMSMLKLPREVCNRLMAMMMHFWLAGFGEGKDVHWCLKDRIMRRKEIHGLGFKDMELFSYAMLAKQARNLICKPNILCAKFLRRLYHPYLKFARAKCSQKGSWSWKGLCKGLEIIKDGCVWSIGNGRNVNILLGICKQSLTLPKYEVIHGLMRT